MINSENAGGNARSGNKIIIMENSHLSFVQLYVCHMSHNILIWGVQLRDCNCSLDQHKILFIIKHWYILIIQMCWFLQYIFVKIKFFFCELLYSCRPTKILFEIKRKISGFFENIQFCKKLYCTGINTMLNELVERYLINLLKITTN